jgi:putative DNA primase/helicase
MTNLNIDEAIDFLKWLRPGPWVLIAINPEVTDDIITATADTEAKARAFIARHNGTRNLYYTLNRVRSATDKKPAKIDIAGIEFLHGDLDPTETETPDAAKTRYHNNLEPFDPKPSATIDSGNGVQVLWRLNEPIELGAPVTKNGKLEFAEADIAKIKNAEDRNKRVMLFLGSKAGTQNIDRVLRLPGTINLPTSSKRKNGRTECMSKVIKITGSTCLLDEFLVPERPQQPPPRQPEPSGTRTLPRSLLNMLYLTGEKPAGYSSKSELLYAFLHEALRVGIDENAIIDACLDEAYRGCSIREHVRNNGDSSEYVQRQIEHAINDADARRDDGRIAIVVKGGNTHKEWRRTQDALISAGAPVYVRGRHLVVPLYRFEKSPEGDSNILTAQIEQLNLERLSDMVASRAVSFLKYSERKQRNLPIDPPRQVVMTLLEAKDWKFKSLHGIVTSPTMRPDGSLLTVEGYDDKTGLWYKPSRDIDLPSIPERPTKEQATKALELLKDLLVGFPFEDEASRSAALAAILTVALRGAFIPAPLFEITAPEARTGKTYLAVLMSILGTGHKPVPTAGGKNEEELEKRVETAALAGRPILFLNNIKNGAVVESEALAQISTEGVIYIRKLGRHEEGVCDCRATTVILNGNNIQVAGDLVVRTVECRLDAHMEDPEKRDFDFDPIERVLGNRGKYLAACFTIARAYIAAERPDVKIHRIAGFEKWSRFVQRPLVWLGREDPLKNMQSAKAVDPSVDDLRQLIEILKKYSSMLNRDFTVAELKKLAEEKSLMGYEPRHPDLHQLMTEQGVRGQINAKRFGYFLRRHVDRKVNGWSIRRVSVNRGSASYRLDAPDASVAATSPGDDPL